jgi:8-oxo-dGTP pyrophosphatase MutT (NUDIX family)
MKQKYRKGIFAVAYSKTERGVEYLLIHRKLHWKGWEFIKGGVRPLESKRRAVKREIKEETGLKVLKFKRLNFSGRYKYDRIFPDRPGVVGQTFSLYAVQVKKGRVRLDKKEHSEYKWVGYEKALKILKWPNQRKSLKIVGEWLER